MIFNSIGTLRLRQRFLKGAEQAFLSKVPSVNPVHFQSLLKNCMQPVLKALVLRCQMPKYSRRPQNCSEIVFEQYDRFCPSSSHCLYPPRLSSVHTLSVRDRPIPHYTITPHNTSLQYHSSVLTTISLLTIPPPIPCLLRSVLCNTVQQFS